MMADTIFLDWRQLERSVRDEGLEPASGRFLVTSRNVILSDPMLLRSIYTARRGDYHLMMIGPWGTGKNVALELIHRGSARNAHEFRNENLVGSQEEIDEKFFGTQVKPGLIEQNDGATIHLDFMENLLDKTPLADKLIALVERGELRRGDGTVARVGVRIIGGANIDLGRALASESRKLLHTEPSNLLLHLYERLSTNQLIRTRQLREMPERLPQLITERMVTLHLNNMVTAESLDSVSHIPVAVMRKLQQHPWNKNFFELAKVISTVIDHRDWDAALGALDETRLPAVFIAYSFSDEEAAGRIYERLEVFQTTKAKEGFPLHGEEWKRTILDAIRRSDFVLICLSERSLKSGGFFHREIREALETRREQPFGRIYIIPLVLDAAAEALIPQELQDLHWAKLYLDWDRELGSVIQAISNEYQRLQGSPR